MKNWVSSHNNSCKNKNKGCRLAAFVFYLLNTGQLFQGFFTFTK